MEYLFTRMKQRVDELKCNNCKYKTNVSNTEETGTAICSYPQGEWFVVNVEDAGDYADGVDDAMDEFDEDW